MKDIKKTLKLAGIMALIINILNISNLFLAIYVYEFSVFAVVENSICIALTFLTAFVYLFLSTKTKQKIIQKKGLFLTLTLLNILNNIFVWIISLWVEIVVSNLARISYLNQMVNKSSDSGANNDINISKNEYEIKKETENLTEALKDLENLKAKNLISEEEYNTLRQNVINKFLNI